MAVFQLLHATINIAGSRDHTIVRGDDHDGITIPEMHVLRVVHGGVEHVHTEMVMGEVERDPGEERARLVQLYGKEAVDAVFPGISPLPTRDDNLPTREEHLAAIKAAEEARAQAKASRGKKPAAPAPAPEPTPAPTPAPAQTTDGGLIPDLTAAAAEKPKSK